MKNNYRIFLMKKLNVNNNVFKKRKSIMKGLLYFLLMFNLCLAQNSVTPPIIKEYSKAWTIGDNNESSVIEFTRIQSINIDSRKQIYVLDRGSNLIKIFDQDGKFVSHFGGKGNGPGEFIQPTRMFIDDKDQKYIYDLQLSKLNIFSTNNKFKKSLTLPGLIHNVKKINGGFVIQRLEFEYKGNIRYVINTYGIYNEKLKLVKDFHKSSYPSAKKSGRSLVQIPFKSDDYWEVVDGKKILIFDSEKFLVNIYDNHGRKIEKFENPQEKEAIKQNEKEEIFKLWSKYYKRTKLKFSDLEFPQKKPFFNQLQKLDNNYFLLSKGNEKNTCYIYDFEGNYLGLQDYPFNYQYVHFVLKQNYSIVQEENNEGLPVLSKYNFTIQK